MVELTFCVMTVTLWLSAYLYGYNRGRSGGIRDFMKIIEDGK
jgi:hypothetical protein